jgi:hypothetical protein
MADLPKSDESRRNATPVLHSRISTGGRNGHYARAWLIQKIIAEWLKAQGGKK